MRMSVKIKMSASLDERLLLFSEFKAGNFKYFFELVKLNKNHLASVNEKSQFASVTTF
jgi:hypothetical protein